MKYPHQDDISLNFRTGTLLEYETESENEVISVKKEKIFKIFKVIKVNSNQLNYKCNIGKCKKIFSSKKRYDNHISTHFYEKVYKCEYDNCNKQYRSRENLTLHMKNKHLNIKPYKCSYCMNFFSHRNGKIYHEKKIHKKENI